VKKLDLVGGVRILGILSAVAIVLIASPSFAQTTFSWTSSTGNFSFGPNWSNGVAPPSTGSNTAVLDFSPAGADSYSATNDFPTVPLLLGGYSFNGTSAGSVTIFTGSNAFQLGPGNFGIVQNGSTPVTFISTTGGAAGSAIFNVSNDFTIGGSGTGTVTIGGATDNVVFTGNGNVNVNFTTPSTAANPNLLIGNIGTGSQVPGEAFNGNLNILAGYVKANRTGGDLFGNATIVNVSSGGTMDMNNNAETFGGLAGNGYLVMGSAGLTFNAPGDRTWNGTIQGTGGVSQSATGTWSLGGTNTYTGTTTPASGTIRTISPNAMSPFSLVSTTSPIGILDFNGFSQTIGGISGAWPISLAGTTLTISQTSGTSRTLFGAVIGNGNITKTGAGVESLLGANTYTGNTTVTAGFLHVVASGSGVSLTGGSLDLITNSNFSPSTFTSSANTYLQKSSTGTLNLSGAMVFAGSGLGVIGGGLAIDDSANNSAKLSGTPRTTITSGVLSLQGNSFVSSAESLSGLSINGSARVAVATGNGTNASFSLGGISAPINNVGATLSLVLTNSGGGVASISTTTANTPNGILGGYAVINGTDWATTGTGAGPFNIAPLAPGSYTSNGFGVGVHSDLSANQSLTGGTSATLRFNAPSAVLSLSNTNTLQNGGILVTPSAGANGPSIADAGFSTGALTTSPSQTLNIQQYDTQASLGIAVPIVNSGVITVSPTASWSANSATLTVASSAAASLYPGMVVATSSGLPTGVRIVSINGNTLTLSQTATATKSNVAVTFTGGTPVAKSGPGTVVLSANNLFTGPLVLNEGTVSAANVNNLGPTTDASTSNSIVFNGGTLEFTANGASTGSGIQPWIFGPAGGVVQVDTGTATKQGNSVAGSGVLVKTGPGTISIGSNLSIFSGPVIVNQGIIRFTSNQFTSAAGMTVNAGGQYQINDNATANWSLASGSVLNLNGTGPSNAGAMSLTVQSPGPGPTSTFTNAVNLQSDTTITANNSGSNISTLILSGAVGGPGNLTKGGAGILTLSNASNNFGGTSGTTTVANGTLKIGTTNALPTSTTLNVSAAGTFELAGQSQTIGGLAGASGGSIVNSSTATSVLTVNYSGSATQFYSGNLGVASSSNGNFALAVTGTGVFGLNGIDNHTGGTTVGPGSLLQIGDGASGSLNGNVVNSGTLAFNVPGYSFSGSVSGSGALAVNGGVTTLTATHSYSGPTLVQNGILGLTGGNNLLPVGSAVTLGDSNNDTGVLQLGDMNLGPMNQTLTGVAVVGNGANRVVGGNAAFSTLTINNASDATFGAQIGGFSSIENSLNFAKTGTGNLTLVNTNNTYAGATTVNQGVLTAGAAGVFGGNSAFTVNAAGTLRLGGNSSTIGGLNGTGTVENANPVAAVLTAGADNGNSTFNGLIRDGSGGGALGLKKGGNGTLTLTGVQTYTGPTTSNVGTLQLATPAQLASPVSVTSGAALAVLNVSTSGTASLLSSLTFGSGDDDSTNFNFASTGGFSTSVPILTVSGGLTVNGTTTINISSPILPVVGNYPLFKYTSLLGSGFNGFTLGTLPGSRVSATLQNNTSTDTVYLHVLGSDFPYWTGAVNGDWDVSTTANWKLNLLGSATTYMQGDAVVFNDNATGTTNVNVTTTVNPASVTFGNSGKTYTLSGPGKISGNTGLQVSGGGLVTLATDNDYTGGTSVNSGTLQLGSGGSNGTIVGDVNVNGTLAFNRADSQLVVNGSISGGGSVVQLGGGMTALAGSNTYSGATIVSNGTLQVGNGGTTGNVPGNVLANGTLAFNRADNTTYSGVISGNGSAAQVAASNLVLTGANTYTGPTIVSAGTLQIDNGGASGSIAGDTITNGTLAFARSDTYTYGGTVSGNGSVAQMGPGNLLLTGNNSHIGGTFINGGTLSIASENAIGGALGNLTFNNGTLHASGPLDIGAGGAFISFGPSGGTIDTAGNNVIIDGQVGGTGQGIGNMTKVGAGTLTLTNGNNSNPGVTGQPHAAAVNVLGGVLSVSSNGNVNPLAIVLNGGALQITADFGSGNPGIASSTDFATAFQIGSSGGTIDTNGHYLATLSPITGNGTLNKIGGGTWYVHYGMGNSGFTGGLHIWQGSVIDADAARGSENDAISNSTIVTVEPGTIFDDSWGNGEDLGGLAGGGDCVAGTGHNFALEANVTTTFSGRIRSALNSVVTPGANSGLTQAGGGTFFITGNASDYGGNTTIQNGTIVVSNSVPSDPTMPGPLGQTASDVLVGNTSGSSNASLLVNMGGVNFGRNVRVQSGNSGVDKVGGTNTSGTVDFSGNLYLDTANGVAVPVTLSAAPGGTVVFSNGLTHAAGATGSGDNVTIVGGGTVAITGASNYLGSTSVQNGTLVVAGGADRLTNTTALSLGDAQNDTGVVQIGDSTGAVSQTVSGIATVGTSTGNAIIGGNASAISTLVVNSNAASTFAGKLGGAFATQNNLGLTMSGTASLFLTGANTYVGPTTVTGGTLTAGSPSAFGVNSAATVNAPGLLQLNGNNLAFGSLAGNGVVENGGAIAATATVGANNSNTSFSGTLRDGNGGGTLALTKVGSGALTLNGGSTYSGPTAVQAGSLLLGSGASIASPTTVAAGAGFGVESISPSATATAISSLTFGAAASDATNLNFNVSGGWSTSVPLLSVSGALAINGTTAVNVATSTLPSLGLYPLVDITGSPAPLSRFALGTISNPRIQASLQVNGDVLDLNVTAVDSAVWTGAVNGTWDINTTSNWKTSVTQQTTKYFQNDAVLLDDTATGTRNINLTAAVTPSSLMVNNSGAAYTIGGAGSIGGSTALVKNGSGLLAILTNNSYSGGTNINGGTMQIGNGGTSGNVPGDAADNATLAFNRSDSVLYSNVISGSGSVVQLGAGMLTLAGNNSYTGQTRVTNGTLQIGNASTSGSLTSDIVNNAAVVFNRSDDVTYANAISGNGTVRQIGGGRLILTGNNTFSGAATVNNGILQVGNGGSTGALTGNIADNATATFSRSDSYAYGGSVSGAGALNQQGPGLLTLTANSPITGTTTVSGGTLQFGNGGTTGSLAGSIINIAAVAFNRSDSVTFGNVISGAGSVTQLGPGVLALTATNSYNGGTYVSGGTMQLGANGNLGNGQIHMNGGVLQLTADFGSGDPTTASPLDLPLAIAFNQGVSTIDTNGHYLATNGQLTGAVGSTIVKTGDGTWLQNYGMGGTFTGNMHIEQGSVVDAWTGRSSNTDAISNSTIITIDPGATWDDSYGNGEDMGGLAGGGTAVILAGGSFNLKATTPTTFSGQLRAGTNGSAFSGASGNFTVSGGGSITLSGTNSDYGGTTSVTNGNLIVSANVAPSTNGPLGNASSAVKVGGAGNAALEADTPGVQFGRDIQLASGSPGRSTVGGLNTSGEVDFTGQIIMGANNGAASPLTLFSAAGGTVGVSGNIVRASGATGSLDSITTTGGGTLVLSGVDNFQGVLDVAAGTTILTSAGVVPDGTSLDVGAGALSLDLTVPSAAPAVSASVSAVPEPGTCCLVLAAALSLAISRLRVNRGGR
jgi:autotransporter-associated beta strand protein